MFNKSDFFVTERYEKADIFTEQNMSGDERNSMKLKIQD